MWCLPYGRQKEEVERSLLGRLLGIHASATDADWCESLRTVPSPVPYRGCSETSKPKAADCTPAETSTRPGTH